MKGVFRRVAEASMPANVRADLAKGAGYPEAQREDPTRLRWSLLLSVCRHEIAYPMTVVFGLENRAVMAPPRRVKCPKCGGGQ